VSPAFVFVEGLVRGVSGLFLVLPLFLFACSLFVGGALFWPCWVLVFYGLIPVVICALFVHFGTSGTYL
jgi:hypothetical protein